MNGELYQVTVQQMKELISSADVNTISDDDWKWTLEFAERSEPLLAGMYDGELICIVGLIPHTTLSNTAYLWVHTTNAVKRHKTKFARYVRKWIRSDRIGYDYIRGHCFVDDLSARDWVGWLGAEFGEVNGPLISFTIRRK